MLKTYYNCPISDKPVHEVLPRDGDFVEFFCPTCGQFRISNKSITSMRHRSRGEREAMLTDARRDAQGGDGIPLIRDSHSHARKTDDQR
jgi:predicted RNA-binding Zn-ribbon protein involved in translation (DUF1610 family)